MRGGVVFPHEECSFRDRYNELELKYKRRIDRFFSETKKKTCFLRSCASSEEVTYILENYQYIDRIIKKQNSQNEIVFLIRKELYIPKPIPFRYYVMSGKYSSGVPLKHYFDDANPFLDFCAHHYDAVSIIKNIVFDSKKGEKEALIRQRRYETLLKLFELDCADIAVPKDIVIYGAGNIGSAFYKKVKGKSNVLCFIDKQKAGKEIGGIPIIRLEELDCSEDISIIVTATYDYNIICEEIKRFRTNAKIISLDSYL